MSHPKKQTRNSKKLKSIKRIKYLGKIDLFLQKFKKGPIIKVYFTKKKLGK